MTPFTNVRRDRADGPYACPCCRYVTLSERGWYEICPVCFWEDDGQDDHDANEVRGGPNHGLSLTEARQNFKDTGASDTRRIPMVRPPLPHEHPVL
ncbi:CPCC family cysteine-rich protein [Streptomyces sp. NBC_00390]|uniref:CPCC family cysteine-rich protein n=1 Tax=Streptomyces sp. NBC_00390 TaxID=2975736 RepID=UPI002E1B4C55